MAVKARDSSILLLDEFIPMVKGHPVNDHPFIHFWTSGKATREHFEYWLRPHYRFTRSFGRVLCALYSRIPDAQWKDATCILQMLMVENWGLPCAGGHGGFYRDLAKWLGIQIDQIGDDSFPWYTNYFCDYRIEICSGHRKWVGAAIAAIALGNELGNEAPFEALRRGIDIIPGLEGCPTEYFDVHLRDEGSDYRKMAELFQALVPMVGEERARILAEEAVGEFLLERQDFLDAFMEDLWEQFSLSL